MKTESMERIREDIRILVSQGYMDQEEPGGALKLNDESREVLFRGRRVTVQRQGRRVEKAQENDGLLQALQRLRYEISAKEYIAASNLFADTTLRDICRQLPRNKKQLAKVDGMGVFKANRYGDRILRLVDLYGGKNLREKGV